MGMHVDKTRTDNLSISIDGFLGRGFQTRRYLSNTAVLNADIGRVTFFTGPIDDVAVANDDVKHYLPHFLQNFQIANKLKRGGQ